VVCIVAIASLGSNANATFTIVGSKLSAGGHHRVAQAPAPARNNPAGKDPGDGAQRKPVPRKIIYRAQVDMIVEDVENAEQSLKDKIEEGKCFLVRAETQGSPGRPRTGVWTIRVPVDHFNHFMEGLAKLGELRRSSTDSEDVTEAYYDLQAHMKNNQVEEAGLQKLYGERAATGKLEDLLAVRRELRAIRTEVDQQQGRLKRWDMETEFSTVTVKLHDRRDYVPPTAPQLSTRIGRTWEGSLDVLTACGKGVVLFAVAVTPWLPVLAAVGGVLWLLRHRYQRRHGGAAPGVLPAPGTTEV
jgi:hypothetical protein